MKNLRLFLLTTVLTLSAGYLLSQTTSPATLPDLIPPTPTSSKLGEYGNTPVGLFTGTPEVSIPLYTIKESGFSLPISLSYRSNGIKVDALPTSVGLSWSLRAGGTITRTLRDAPDEDNSLKEEDSLDIYLNENIWGTDKMNNFLSGVANDINLNTEPDIFSISTGKFSNSFFLDTNRVARLINPSPIKVQLLNGFGGVNEPAFLLTDKDGIKYWYGGLGATESTRNRTYGNGGGPHPISQLGDVTNSWYLTKIQLLNGDTIHFTYTQNSVIYDGGISQTVTGDKKVSGGSGQTTSTYFDKAVHTLPTISSIYASVSQLTKIQWKGGEVDFKYSLMNTCYGGTYFEKLDSVLVYDNHKKLIKVWALNYLKESTQSSYAETDVGTESTDLNTHRVFLDSVKQIVGNTTVKKYSFEYYNPDQLPPRLSYSRDYWGFFNGKHNADLVPKGTQYFYNSAYPQPQVNLTYTELTGLFSNVGGDRDADFSYGIDGLIKKVTYPTGGTTTFDYEANSTPGTQVVYPPKTNIYLHETTSSTQFGGVSESDTTGVIPFEQDYVPFYMSIMLQPDAPAGYPTNHAIMIFNVKDLTTGEDAPVYTYSSTTGEYILVSTDEMTLNSSLSGNTYVSLEAGHNYVFQITLDYYDLDGSLSISYYNKNETTVQVNSEIGGGRIKKIIDDGADGAPPSVRNYYYGNIDSLDVSSGMTVPPHPSLSFSNNSSTTMGFDGTITFDASTTVSLSSNTLYSLYNSTGNFISYSYVTVGIGSNNKGGFIVLAP